MGQGLRTTHGWQERLRAEADLSQLRNQLAWACGRQVWGGLCGHAKSVLAMYTHARAHACARAHTHALCCVDVAAAPRYPTEEKMQEFQTCSNLYVATFVRDNAHNGHSLLLSAETGFLRNELLRIEDPLVLAVSTTHDSSIAILRGSRIIGILELERIVAVRYCTPSIS